MNNRFKVISLAMINAPRENMSSVCLRLIQGQTNMHSYKFELCALSYRNYLI